MFASFGILISILGLLELVLVVFDCWLSGLWDV